MRYDVAWIGICTNIVDDPAAYIFMIIKEEWGTWLYWDGDSKLLQNISTYMPIYETLYLIRMKYLLVLVWEPHISKLISAYSPFSELLSHIWITAVYLILCLLRML